jgi:PAS domain S-box-containing protein
VQTDSETRVLLAAATVKDGEITRSLLAREGLACVVCRNLRDLTAEIDAGVGAIVLTEEAFGAEGLDELLARLEKQPSWSDIPVVILMQGDRGSLGAAGILHKLRNLTLLERPAPMRSVASAVQAAVRARLRQYQIRRQIETIREGQQQFEALANSIPQLAWMAKPDGSIFWYNQRWHDYCGTTHGQMEGWGWEIVHDQKLLPRIAEKWKAALISGEPWEDTFPLRRHDGEMRWHLSRAMPLRNAEGNIVFWFGTNTDIEGQRKIAEERKEFLDSERAARADAERAGRLKDEFLATLSHELRTPLNAILGWAQILRRQNNQDKELNEGLSIIERNARVQAQLIEDLLDMSRIISGKLRIDVQQVNIADIANAAIESARPAAEAKGIRLVKILNTEVGPVRGDPARLQQIIWNLLSNAVKFTPKNGKVQVVLQRVDSHVEIIVSDSGIGIKPEFLPYVFDRFRQADSSTTRKHGGLGLGLAIVKNLVELHGGNAQAKSPGEGLGAAFSIELPLMVLREREPNETGDHPRRSQSVEARELFHERDALLGVSVLVLDDEEDARSLISRVLEECKARVVAASSVSEAMEILQHERPTVIVSDIGMPDEDGYEFIRRVRQLSHQQGGKTPAAALTAFARSEDRTRALRAGYQSHVSKPVEPTELVAVVASLAGRTLPKSLSGQDSSRIE